MSSEEEIVEKTKKFIKEKSQIIKENKEKIKKLKEKIKEIEETISCAECGVQIDDENDMNNLSVCKVCNKGVCYVCRMYHGWRDCFNNQTIGICHNCYSKKMKEEQKK